MAELTDEIIERVLEKLEQDKTVEEILILFPQFHDELVAIFQTTVKIKDSANDILPNQALLSSILNKIPNASVTNTDKARYDDQNNRSLLNIFATLLKQARYGVPIALVAILLIIVGFSKITAPNYQTQEAGSIDQILQPLNRSVSQTQAISDQETSFDQQMVLADAQSLDSLDQPYDDSQTQ